MNNAEIIDIDNVNNLIIPYTTARKLKFGNCPRIQCWLQGEDLVYYLSDVQPALDQSAPNISQIEFVWPTVVKGFVVLK